MVHNELFFLSITEIDKQYFDYYRLLKSIPVNFFCECTRTYFTINNLEKYLLM